MQRLYSNFANGWAGHGLLLLRVVVAVFGIERAVTGAWAPALAGALLLVGWWTPAAGAAAAAGHLWLAVRAEEARVAHLFAAAIAASLAMLGPGAWSLDARRFGRRRIPGSGRD